MNRPKIIIFLIFIILILFIGTFLYGRYLGKTGRSVGEKPLNISSQLILERITSQYFLVTKTVFINSRVEIETPRNNNWTDLFLGQKITVHGIVRVDVGVDMNKLSPDNIAVNNLQKIITISLPPAEILDSSLSGELDVDEEKAIVEKLKGIFKDTKNEDYNLAMSTLIDNAKSQVINDEAVFAAAKTDSLKLVELIVSSMLDDYEVVIK